MTYQLSVDLGTTFTAAAVASDAEPTVVGLGTRTPQIPSVLFRASDGEFLVGEAAEMRGLSEPDRVVREFKRRIGDSTPMLVAGEPFSPQLLTSHLLRWVLARTTEGTGGPPSEVVLTHPANWQDYKLSFLREAASLAGLEAVQLCPEPQAAAMQYAARTRVAPGTRLAVYDLGGGTVDVCLFEKSAAGFTLLGQPAGVEQLGGVDFDELLFSHVLHQLGPAGPGLRPDESGLGSDVAMVTALARLRRDCVAAKEHLSSDLDAVIPVAWLGQQLTVRVTRAEFEALIRPRLDATVEVMHRALRSARVEPSELDAVVLTGGSSRIPLVAEVLAGSFGLPVALDIHPKHDIVLGALRAVRDRSATTAYAATPTPSAPRQPPPDRQPRPPETPDHPPVGRGLAALIAALAVVAGVVSGLVLVGHGDRGSATAPPASTTPPVAAAAHAWPVADEPLPDRAVVSSKERGGDWGVEVVDARDGATLRILLDGPEADTMPVLSPDRRTVAYLRWADNRYSLRVIAADGRGDAVMLPRPPEECITVKRPAWSRDNLLALPCEDAAGETLLLLLGPDGQLIRLLDRGYLGDPTFTADGLAVVYWHSDGNGDGGSLLKVAIDGASAPVELTPSADGQDNDPACSPDGSQLAFRRTLGRTKSIAVLDLSGDADQRVRLLTTGLNDQDPSWSPGSDQIIFKRGPNENADLYVIAATGGPARAVIEDDEPDTTPAWTAR